MATLYANSAGNWTAAIWYDIATGQPYANTYPQDDDDVYLNGYNVTLPSINHSVISAKSITNGLCEATGRSGGALTGGYTVQSNVIRREIDANIIVDGNSPMLIGGNGVETIINGNVTINNGDLQNSNSSYRRFITINGNVEVHNGLLTGNGTTLLTNVTINGNATFHNNPLPTNINEFYCYQNLTIEVNITPKYAYVSYLHAKNSKVIAPDIEIGNAIDYDLAVTDYRCGIKWTNSFVISNINSFTWKDLSNPKVNPFIIVTNAEMNNQNQYPSPANVKKDVPYAWGNLTGQYLPDYPIPQNVLKDVSYDSGSLIGTLEIPQVPTTSDIVTAIKNDDDLGGKINTTNTNVGNISTAVTTIDGKVDIIDTNVDTLLSRLTSVLTQRLGQSVTVEILQQILVAHLDN